jgi:hypothetical protein
MLDGILAMEEERANDMHDLLVTHEGWRVYARFGLRPSLHVATAHWTRAS